MDENEEMRRFIYGGYGYVYTSPLDEVFGFGPIFYYYRFVCLHVALALIAKG